MPSVFDQPTRWPASRAMCAIIREVVVLPLVPVTATTGTLGRIVVGPGPRSVEATWLRGALDEGARRRSSPEAVDDRGDRLAERAGTVAVSPRVGHDDARPARWWAARVRRDGWCPDSAATRRTSRVTSRVRERWRKPLIGASARRELMPRRSASRRTSASGASRQGGHVEGELDGRPREVEVGSLEDPQLDQRRRRLPTPPA